MIQILIYSFVTGTQVLLLALALFLVYSVSRAQNLALGAIATSVAYALYFSLEINLPLWGVILFSILVAFAMGSLNFFLNEPFAKKQEYLLALLTSFSLAIIIESMISIAFGTDGKSLVRGVLSIYEFGPYQIPLPGLLIIGLGFFITLISFFVVRYTPWGRVLKGIAESPFSAVSLGVNSRNVRFWVYILGSVIAGAIGILSGFNTALVPMMGFQLIIMAFIAFLVGGVFDIRGTIIASYLVALVPEFVIGLSQNISSNWRMVLVFTMAFVLLSFRPNGLFASREKRS